MDKMLIRSSRPLRGATTVSGSKNAGVAILMASLLSVGARRAA